MSKIRIGGIWDISTVDWKGHNVFMIFCSGCNFNCPYCDNSSLIPIDSGEIVEIKEIKTRLISNNKFVDAIGFTGGEPSLQPKSIIRLCNWAKEKGLKTFLNTNGSNSDLIKKLFTEGVIDYVALDVKAPLIPETYGSIIGKKNDVKEIIKNIKQVIHFCDEVGLPLETRTTIVPTLIDDEKSIIDIAKYAKKSEIYVIQEFFPFEGVPNEKLRNLQPPRKDLLLKLAKAALTEGVKEVYTRTRQNGLEKVLL